jgi:flagellar export protein FliJ
MPQFQFRLKTLLAIRQSTRQERRAQLADGLAAQRDLERARGELRQELADQWQLSTTAGGRRAIDIERLAAGDRYRGVLRARLACLAQDAAALSTEIEVRQQALAVAEREVRVLDKLRERQHECFRYEQARRENNAADEVATLNDLARHDPA